MEEIKEMIRHTAIVLNAWAAGMRYCLLKQKIEDLDKKMLENATNSKKLGELLDEKSQCEKLLDEKMERWMYLEDLAERIANGEEV